MKNVYVLAAKNLNDSQRLFIGEFDDSELKKKLILTNDHRVVQGRLLSETERVFKHMFSLESRELPIELDDEKDSSFIKAMQRHPLVETEGNPNLAGNPSMRFEFINKSVEKNKRVVFIKEQGMVFNMINNLTVEEIRNIAFLYGLNPIHMSIEETYLALVDFQNGRLMANPKDFIASYKSEDVQYRVVAKKAILLGVIKMDNHIYYIEDKPIGKTEEDVVLYCKQNKELYEGYIRKEVIKRDNLSIDLKEVKIENALNGNIVAEKDKTQIKTEAFDALEELRGKAKLLGIQGYAVMKEENLKKKIKEAEEKVPV